ncbi:MAG: hypothetical protein A2Z78_01980 [Candidatus Nealsonbacteria bacterium RBG_13_36_15]|uniref:Uncharacterized protein n=1 Tax=Candidatus Nealsonbacteria bacterium RBG_13_36_15 TaxID=1801660 RepID=A0A1G2DVR3_9BACT|nr:MAG: hypothetical protein A2Z78_01980 [Candidatus Nealsonbacteria bacterium RBG_13_36_15]
MPEEILREDLWKLYEKLPKELQEIIFSEKTADDIGVICQKNEVPESKVPEVAKYTGRVLMSLLPPNELEEVLVKNVKLKGETAKNVAREITRFVFLPVKELLSQIYEAEVIPTAKAEKTTLESLPKEPASETPVSEKQEKPKESDTYREPVG